MTSTTIERTIIEPGFVYLHGAAHDSARHIVRESWTMHAERCRTAVERALPDTAIQLCFNLGSVGRQIFTEGPRQSLSPRDGWVVGPHARALLIEKEIVDCDIVTVRLQPGVARLLLGIPASELRESIVDLGLLWPSGVSPILDALRSVPVVSRRAVAERAVLSQVRHEGFYGDAVLTRRLYGAMGETPGPSVGEMAAAFGLSHRRVISLFDAHVGLKPKIVGRVQRLRRVLNCVHAEHRPSWTQVAHDCGYFDQSHMINDFRLQAGITPAEYDATRSSVGRGFARYRLAADR